MYTSCLLEIKEGFKHSWRLIFPFAETLSSYRGRKSPAIFLSLLSSPLPSLANFLERNQGRNRAMRSLIARIPRTREKFRVLASSSSSRVIGALWESRISRPSSSAHFVSLVSSAVVISFGTRSRAGDRLFQRTQNYFLDKLD